MSESILMTAFIVGFLGGVHCLGMCGGIVGGLTFGLEVRHQQSWWRMLPYQLAYNSGRIVSYGVIGALFGTLGMLLGNLAVFLPIQQVLQLVAGLFMIALGLYLAGWWFGVVAVEKLGSRLWAKLQPVAKNLTPIKTIRQSFVYGLVWGWLPCGLVYSMLIMAIAAGSALGGSLVMIAFGLGTLPNLLLMGVFAFYFTRFTRHRLVRQFSGALVISMGVWQMYLASVVSV